MSDLVFFFLGWSGCPDVCGTMVALVIEQILLFASNFKGYYLHNSC